MTMGDRIRPSRTPGTTPGGPRRSTSCNTPPHHPTGPVAPPIHRNPAINPTPGLGQRAK